MKNPVLVCSDCRSSLKAVSQGYECCACGRIYPVYQGKAIMREMAITEDQNTHEGDWLDKLKSIAKKNPRLYRDAIDLLSPVYNDKRLYQKLRKRYRFDEGLVINIGSGNSRLNADFINFDYYPYDNVDVVGDINALPFPDDYFDTVINIVVLEHIARPDLGMKEMHRVLKKNGIIFTIAPFMQGFHASPYDYRRWSSSGIDSLHEAFNKLESGVCAGPTSGMLWIMQEWLAQFLSLGIMPLYKVLFIILMLITWPIKFLDALLVHHPMSRNIASSFYYMGRK